MSDEIFDSGRRSFEAIGGDDWPQTPDQLVYRLDLVVELFDRLHAGERIDLVESLLDCVDWRQMFGSEVSGFLAPGQIEELRAYYRAKFSALEPYYLGEQLSTELLTALMSSGDLQLSDDFKRLGSDRPFLWNEIRTFFSRKEIATVLVMLAGQRPAP